MELGEGGTSNELASLVYDALRRLATQKLSCETPGQTLQPTALVHEVYLRLVDGRDPKSWKSRGHFFGAAAEAMRRILVDNARRKGSEKHGGNLKRQPLDDATFAAAEPSVDVVALDDALEVLAEHDPGAAELVKLRFFAGLTSDEAAEILGISSRTAERTWNYARAFLRNELSE